jgi:hypothetical protein
MAGACASKVSRVHYGGTCVSQSYSKVSHQERGRQENNRGREWRRDMVSRHEDEAGFGAVSRRRGAPTGMQRCAGRTKFATSSAYSAHSHLT